MCERIFTRFKHLFNFFLRLFNGSLAEFLVRQNETKRISNTPCQTINLKLLQSFFTFSFSFLLSYPIHLRGFFISFLKSCAFLLGNLYNGQPPVFSLVIWDCESQRKLEQTLKQKIMNYFNRSINFLYKDWTKCINAIKRNSQKNF